MLSVLEPVFAAVFHMVKLWNLFRMGFSKYAINEIIPALVTFRIGTEADVRRARASIDRLPVAENIPLPVIARTLRAAALSDEQISMIMSQMFLFIVVWQYLSVLLLLQLVLHLAMMCCRRC